MQSIRITSRPTTKKRDWNQFSQLKWASTKVIYIKKTWAGYIWQTVKKLIEAANEGPAVLRTCLWSLSDISKKVVESSLAKKKVFHARHGRFIDKQPQEEETFLERNKFSNRNNVRSPMQVRKKDSPGVSKDDFSSRMEPSIFKSIAPVLLAQSNKILPDFSALKSTSYILPESTVSCRSNSSSQTYSSCCHKSDTWPHLE